MWLLALCDDLITTAGSSFGYLAAAPTRRPPLTISKIKKCVRQVAAAPFSHGWLMARSARCFDEGGGFFVPEFDMICQDCIYGQVKSPPPPP
jgi:hypothetical protein